MVNGKKLGGNIFSIMVLAVGVSCVGFLACGGNGESDPKSKSASESVTPYSQKTDLQSSKEKSPATKQISAIPADWKTFQFQGWSISLPSNWSGDADAGVWWPGEGNLNMGRPALSVQRGGIPLMPTTDFEDRVISHINGDPQERKNVSVSGFSGFKCSWEFMGKKHLGLFLEEKIGGGMAVIHFVDCQAPSSDFDQHKVDFEKIVAYIKK